MFFLKIAIINLLHVNVNNTFYEKGTYIFQMKIFLLRVALFYIFANLFNVWLKRRQLYSLIWFCIQFAEYPTSYIFWRFSLYTCEGKRVKMENDILVWLWKLLWICAALKGSWGLLVVFCFLLWIAFVLRNPVAEFTTWLFSNCFMHIRLVHNLNCKYCEDRDNESLWHTEKCKVSCNTITELWPGLARTKVPLSLK